jgi:hypothetical protein
MMWASHIHVTGMMLIANIGVYVRHELIIESVCLWLEDVNAYDYVMLHGKEIGQRRVSITWSLQMWMAV